MIPKISKTERYQPLKELGRGQFAKVELCYDKDSGKTVAIKWLYDVKNQEVFMNEYKTQSKCHGKGIIKIVASIENNKNFGIVMKAGKIDLLSYILENGTLTEKEVLSLFKPVFKDLEHIHFLGILHNDIKLENLIIFQKSGRNVLKLTDFGFSEELPQGKDSLKTLGSLHYLAPEVFQKKPHNDKSDVFSLGVVLFCCLTGEYPFDGDDDYEYSNNLMLKEPNIPLLENLSISTPCIHVIQSMLTKNPKQRPSIHQCLSMEWFKNS